MRRFVCWLRVQLFGFWTGHDPVRVINHVRVLEVSETAGGLEVEGQVVEWQVICWRCRADLGYVGSPWPRGSQR